MKEGPNSSKFHKNRCPCLSVRWVPKTTFKTQFRKSRQKCIFWTLVWPTLNEKKIAPNLLKIGVDAYLSNVYLNWLSKVNSKKGDKSAYFQPLFDQPWTWAKIAPNIIKIGVHAYLSNGSFTNALGNEKPRTSSMECFTWQCKGTTSGAWNMYLYSSRMLSIYCCCWEIR